MADETELILVDQIEPLIREIRGQKVVLDSDLAALYGVPTKVLNQAIQRNLERFAVDEEELVEQVRITLFHELGHYLGFDEEGLDAIGLA